MKRSLRALLMAGVIGAALVGPAAAPASAATCVGIWYDENGDDYIGAWPCDPCPRPAIQGPLDGHFHVVLCQSII